MCPGFLSLAALLLPLWLRLTGGTPVIEDVLEARSAFGSDCVLQCTAKPKPGVQYLAVRWYKVREPLSRLSGILTKDLPDGEMRLYRGEEREVELHHGSHNMSLPNVTCSDSGLYVCHLAAPVGEQNRDGYVRLTLTDCSDSPTKNLMTDTDMVVAATAVLILALVTFPISYVCLRNTLRDRNKKITKEILLDAPLKPLEKKDLMLIYTLGPKAKPTMKHFCV